MTENTAYLNNKIRGYCKIGFLHFQHNSPGGIGFTSVFASKKKSNNNIMNKMWQEIISSFNYIINYR